MTFDSTKRNRNELYQFCDGVIRSLSLSINGCQLRGHLTISDCQSPHYSSVNWVYESHQSLRFNSLVRCVKVFPIVRTNGNISLELFWIVYRVSFADVGRTWECDFFFDPSPPHWFCVRAYVRLWVYRIEMIHKYLKS